MTNVLQPTAAGVTFVCSSRSRGSQTDGGMPNVASFTPTPGGRSIRSPIRRRYMRNPRRLRLLAGLLAVPLLITACGGDDGDEGDKGKTDGESGGSFSVYIGEPEHLIPQNTNESNGSEIL